MATASERLIAVQTLWRERLGDAGMRFAHIGSATTPGLLLSRISKSWEITESSVRELEKGETKNPTAQRRTSARRPRRRRGENVELTGQLLVDLLGGPVSSGVWGKRCLSSKSGTAM
jgi:hypothetical protein